MGKATLVVATVGMACRMVVMICFITIDMQVILQANGLVAMMMMRYDGHRQHQDAEQK